MKRSPRIGIGGPVGSGKTMLCLKLCQQMRTRWSMAVVTNDIYCSEDAQFLIKHSALPAERIAGVETGGCPHTAIRDDTTMNEQACRALGQAQGVDAEVKRQAEQKLLDLMQRQGKQVRIDGR